MRKSYVTPQSHRLPRTSDASATGGSSGGYRYSMGRQSIIDSVRRSSIMENRRERLQIDKHSHSKNFTGLLAFLSDHKYSVPTTAIRLQSAGSTKEVVNILQFLLGFVYHDYPAVKKFEDEFPVILKQLKYPYTINKRQLQPVGSAHNWPTIVHGLHWLSNLAKYHLCLEENPFQMTAESTDGVAKLAALKMNLDAYNLFMKESDEDGIKAQDEHFIENELEKFVGLGGLEIEKMTELENKLSECQRELDLEIEREHVLDRQILSLQSDELKVATYLEESKTFNENLKKTIEKMKEKCIENHKRIEQLEEKLKEVQAVVTNQKITSHDIQQLKNQITHLQSQISTKKSMLDALLKEQGDLDLESLIKIETIDNEIEEYHRLAVSCKIIPVNAENAQGYDYAIFLQNPESDASPSNVHDLNGRLKLILKQWKEANRSASTDQMRLMEDLQKMKNMLTSKNNDIIEMNSNILRQQELFSSKESDYKKSKQRLHSELSALEERIAELKIAAKSDNVEELEVKVTELRSKYKRMEEAASKREKELSECLLGMTEEFLKLKNNLQSRIDKLTEQVVEYNKNKDEIEGLKFDANQAEIEELKQKAAHLKEVSDTLTVELKKLFE